jgi:hypothetical protein
MYLEAIHNFVEVLNEYFHNVCELDLVFNFYKVKRIFFLFNFNGLALLNLFFNKGIQCCRRNVSCRRNQRNKSNQSA